MKINGKKYKINIKKMITSTIILIAIICLGVFGATKLLTRESEQKNEETSVATSSKVEKVVKEDKHVNLVAIGDVMCHNTNYQTAYNSSTKTYDFMPAFKNIAQYVEKGDITIGNLETTFAGADRGYSGYPTFNSPEALGEALKEIGVDIVSTANNHCMDKGAKGVVATLDNLDKIGISHTGTYRSKEEQDTVLVKEVNGLKIAFLSFTYGTNGIPIPNGQEYLVNLIDENLILEQIELAKKQNVDLICASMHWGIEYAQKQNKEQEKLADLLFQNGVDIIIGNHAHVIEPMEKRNITLPDGTEKEVFVVYALGNFISAQTKQHTRDTAILDMKITQSGETGKISIDEVDYTPVYCYDKGKGVYNRYELVDIRTSMKEYEEGKGNISASLYNTLKSELADIEKVLGDPIKKTELKPQETSEEV